MTQRAFLVTCEHGGNRVPAPLRRWFDGKDALLATHRGYDAGALEMGRKLAQSLGAPFFSARVTRLVIDLNRSAHHPRLFSEFTRHLADWQKEQIYLRHYLPYRQRVEDWVARAVAAGSLVVHVSSHSFTPELDGKVRTADCGLLYDPSRNAEAGLCRAWQRTIRARAPGLVVRRNYPYRGIADGLTSYLRRRFSARRYAGIELEINQKHVGTPYWGALQNAVAAALGDVLAERIVVNAQQRSRSASDRL